jgi:hypothetical protein
MSHHVIYHEYPYIMYEGVDFASPDQYVDVYPKCNRKVSSFYLSTVKLKPVNKCRRCNNGEKNRKNHAN